MKIKPPFILHTVPISGGERWYLAPLKLWTRKVFCRSGTKTVTSWDYARPGMYLGKMCVDSKGEKVWREL